MSDVSKIDVIGLSLGWLYVGIHIGDGNYYHWTVQLLAGMMVVVTLITFSEA